MFAIMGITGQVGGAVAAQLLADGEKVRAVLRDEAKAAPWAARGCEVAVADISDSVALERSFAGVEGVFVLLPPVFDPSPDFAEARAMIAAVRAALEGARPARVVCLSTVGAQATEANLLRQLGLLEEALATLDLPVACLRAAWFMENASWDVAAARAGAIDSFLQPLDRAIPMVATADIGATAARLLRERWTGRRIVELQGGAPVSPADLAAAFGRLLGKPVAPRAVPRAQWEAMFRAQGMRNPGPRMAMLDGFNQGWLTFAGGAEVEQVRGATTLDIVLRALLAQGRTNDAGTPAEGGAIIWRRKRDGVHLACKDVGAGHRRPMVFLHGWGCDHTYLAPQQAHFARTRRTIAVDLRGHGASDAPAGGYAVATMADDVAWLCRELGVADAILVGHSMGGQIALACAARHPAQVVAVVAIDSVLFPPLSHHDEVRAVLDALASPDAHVVLARIADRFFLPDEDPELKATYLHSLADAPRHALIAALASHTVDCDMAGFVAGCRCPLAYIGAELPLADLDALRALCPDVRIAKTLGAGHFSPLLVPGQVNAMLETFERVALHRARHDAGVICSR